MDRHRIVSRREKESAGKPVTIVDILKKAYCPLTETQTKKLKELDLSEGREVFRTLYEMFDEKQFEALKKALGTRPGRNDMPDIPRFLFQVVLFEKAQCPLTEKQLEELKALPMERGSWQKINEIFHRQTTRGNTEDLEKQGELITTQRKTI